MITSLRCNNESNAWKSIFQNVVLVGCLIAYPLYATSLVPVIQSVHKLTSKERSIRVKCGCIGSHFAIKTPTEILLWWHRPTIVVPYGRERLNSEQQSEMSDSSKSIGYFPSSWWIETLNEKGVLEKVSERSMPIKNTSALVRFSRITEWNVEGEEEYVALKRSIENKDIDEAVFVFSHEEKDEWERQKLFSIQSTLEDTNGNIKVTGLWLSPPHQRGVQECAHTTISLHAVTTSSITSTQITKNMLSEKTERPIAWSVYSEQYGAQIIDDKQVMSHGLGSSLYCGGALQLPVLDEWLEDKIHIRPIWSDLRRGNEWVFGVNKKYVQRITWPLDAEPQFLTETPPKNDANVWEKLKQQVIILWSLIGLVIFLGGYLLNICLGNKLFLRDKTH